MMHHDLNPFAPSIATRARVPVIREAFARGDRVRAAVIGAGKSGTAAAELLRRRGAEVIVLDDKASAGVSGKISSEALEAMDLVVLSPGVPKKRPELARSIDRGVLVGEIELSSWFVDAPLLAITGTNGKSTTTALLAHLIAASGRTVFAGGNLGRPLAELALSEEKVDAAVIELSSYQLESIVDASFEVACWLNLTPDHADRYTNIDEYALAKRRIVEQRAINGVAVLNAKDSRVAQAGLRMGGPLRWFAADTESDLAVPMGTLLIDRDHALRGDERYDLANPYLPGIHNRANMIAALECARCFGVEVEAVQRGLLEFRGLPHRIELVGTARGARWFNDSKATNLDSAMTAIIGVSGPKILIAGGRDKGAPWNPLVDLAEKEGVRAVLAVGEAEEIVMTSFAGRVSILERCKTLDRAVARAAELAKPGDSVLLSPACASLDQFTNYEARGNLFRELVAKLSEEERS
jgi:UDP-N-acetylmuramoylalanine--D-glutamate ligase